VSPERAAIILCSFLLLVCIVACICVHEDRQRRRLDRYRPTHDNRFAHRDEFKAFMRDCK